MAVKVKAKRGRPKKGPIDLAEVRWQTQESIRRSKERHGVIDFEQTEAQLETMLDQEALAKCTRAEIKELRRMAERLWDKFQIEKEYEEEQAWLHDGVYPGGAPAGQMDAAAWEEAHGFLKPKRKNAKKTKNIYSLTDKQKERKGLSSEKLQVELDIEATEKAIEERLMNEAIARAQAENKTTLKGRRVTGRSKHDPVAAKKKSFWI